MKKVPLSLLLVACPLFLWAQSFTIDDNEVRHASRPDTIFSVPMSPEGRTERNPSQTNGDVGAYYIDTVYSRITLAPMTNLLVPALNTGVCVPLGKHLSLDVAAYYPWLWHDKANSRCFETLAGDLSLRWWINPRAIEGVKGNTLTGHSLAVGVFGGYGDLEWRWNGVQYEAYGAYLDYAYTFYINKYLRLSLEVAVGVARVPWRNYTVYYEGGRLVRSRPVFEHRETWAGPVKAAVTLSFPIMVKEKEGRR